MTALHDAALAYAELGWPVFPLTPRGKVPLIPKAAGGNGCHDATTDASLVKRWWTRHPDANIGLAAGTPFWVLDADYKGWSTTQPDGADTIAYLRREFGALPPTVRQYTGGMGWQWFFAPDARIRNGVQVLPGLDTRSTGGYVVAPPSVHPDTGRTYRWVTAPGEAEIAPAPEWLIRLLEPVELPPPQVSRQPVAGGNIVRYGEAALGRACERIGSAVPGEQCDVLDRQAYGIGRLVAGGVIPRDLAEAGLVAAGRRMACQPDRRPWTEAELARRVGRAFAAAARSPRTPEVRP